MSAPVPLQTRVLNLLEQSGPIRAKDIGHWLPGFDRSLLDTTLNALMRTNKVSLALGSYDLVSRLSGHEKAPPAPPPSAQEEAAASLVPLDYECDRCHETQPRAAFRHSKYGKRYKVCRRCTGKDFGVKPARLERSEGNPSQTVQSTLGKRSNSTSENPPANTTPGATAVSPGTPLDKDPPAAADSAAGLTHTPPRGAGPYGPPAASPEQPSEQPAQGTSLTGVVTEPSEALPPVGADSALTSLAQKRASLLERGEQLKLEYETKVAALYKRIVEIDDVTEQVNRLVSEVV